MMLAGAKPSGRTLTLEIDPTEPAFVYVIRIAPPPVAILHRSPAALRTHTVVELPLAAPRGNHVIILGSPTALPDPDVLARAQDDPSLVRYVFTD
jgi:hypothetical protein